MSASEFYISKGFTPKNKVQTVDEGAAVAVWTPLASTRVVVTELTIAASNAGTILFTWGATGGDRVAEFLTAGSVSLVPAIGCWEGTAYDRALYATPNAGSTAGYRINLTGFELP